MKTVLILLALFFIGGGLVWVFAGIEKDADDLEDPEKDAK